MFFLFILKFVEFGDKLPGFFCLFFVDGGDGKTGVNQHQCADAQLPAAAWFLYSSDCPSHRQRHHRLLVQLFLRVQLNTYFTSSLLFKIFGGNSGLPQCDPAVIGGNMPVQ